MKLPVLCLLAAVAAAPVRAADKPLFLTGGPKAEDDLRRFVERDPALKARLDEASRQEESLLAAGRDPDLRDSVSDANGPDQFKRRLASASASDRADIYRRLPGVQTPVAATCRALSECPAPELSAEVADPALLPDVLRRMVRPWMLLQQARGSELQLIPAEEPGETTLKVALKGLSPALKLNVTPGRGGFKIWFERPQELAALYAGERDAALKSRR
ncbi:MAG: hypothetical protein ACHQ49_09465 [Elusimicrobiota bacterium]